jgi:hypothetical protein
MRRVEGEPVYYLLASIDRSHDEGDVALLEAAKPAGAKKLHWRDLGLDAQARSLHVIAGMDLQLFCVSARPMNMRKQERARRKCLELLLPLLEAAGVGMLVLESRNEAQNKRDRELVMSARRKHLITRIDLSHEPGEGQPMLWVPDQVVGALGAVEASGAAPSEWSADWRRIERGLIAYTVTP